MLFIHLIDFDSNNAGLDAQKSLLQYNSIINYEFCCLKSRGKRDIKILFFLLNLLAILQSERRHAAWFNKLLYRANLLLGTGCLHVSQNNRFMEGQQLR